MMNVFNLSAAQPDETEHWSKAIETYTGVKITRARDPHTGRINSTTTPEAGAPLTAERLFGWHASLFPTGRSNMKKIAVGAWHETIVQHLCDLT